MPVLVGDDVVDVRLRQAARGRVNQTASRHHDGDGDGDGDGGDDPLTRALRGQFVQEARPALYRHSSTP